MRSRRSVWPLIVLIGLVGLIGGLSPAASVGASSHGTERRTGAERDSRDEPANRGAALPHRPGATTGPVEVVAELSAPPAVRARSQGRGAVARQRQRVGREQEAVIQSAADAVSARPVARLTEALNAVAFRLDRADVDALAEVAGVQRVLPVPTYRQRSGDMREQVGAQPVLDDPDGPTGDGVRVAVLDTGVDYTHAAFGGPGTESAYEEAADAKRDGQRPSSWPDEGNAVVDGIDFLGPDWERPGDPREGSDNPLDLEGHGTSVAAMAGGAEGVAPDADVLAAQVCSSVTPFCDGIAVLEGIDWAVEHDADVINLSLGVPYLAPDDDPAGRAVAEAVEAGVTVVVAGGNNGNRPYATGSPASVPGTIAVAETVLDGAEFEQPLAFTGLRDANGDEVDERVSVHQRWSQMPNETLTVDVDLGEQPGDDAFCEAPLPEIEQGSAVLVFDSPTCAASEKAANVALQGGAVALIGLPAPTEPASSARRECPEDACQELPAYAFAAEDLLAIDERSGAVSLDLDEDATVRIEPERATARQRRIAGTSSRGPRAPDGGAKPDLAAPGSAEVALAGSGDQVAAFGGTSGASPVVAGAAALLLEQARADGSAADPAAVKARLMATADPELDDESGGRAPLTRLGVGQLRVDRALEADVVAVNADEPEAGPQVSFGFVDVAGDRALERDVAVRNLSAETRTATVTLADPREPAGWSLSADEGAVELAPDATETVTVRGGIDSASLGDWPLDSGRRGGDGSALTGVEATARLEVEVADGRDTSAAVHGFARLAADLRTDAAAVIDGELSFSNHGAEVGQVDLFDLIGEADGVASRLGAFSAEVADGQALLSLAVTFTDRLAHANTRQVVVELSPVDGGSGAELVVLDVGFLLFGFPIGESVTVLGEPTAVTGRVNVVDVQSTDHGLHSPTLVLPSQPTLLEGLASGDLIDVTVTAFGTDTAQPLGTIEGRVRLGESRYDADFVHVAPGTSEPMPVTDRGTPEGSSVSGALAVLDGPLLGEGFSDELPPYVGAPRGEETLVLPAPSVKRLGGADRFATARAISQDAFADGGADTVVLARADDFADALAGAPLAVARDGPLLLTTGDRLHEPTAAEIDRVLGDDGEVVLLGGTSALSEQVRTEVQARGHTVRRIAGATRVETAVEIAGRLGDPDELLIADGFDFPDALAAGAAAADRGAAVLLTTPDEPAGSLQTYLSGHPATTWAVGGPAARAFPEARALTGATRFETAEQVARRLFDAPASAGLARGDTFPDALAGGSHAGAVGGPVLLSGADALHPAAGRVLCDVAGSFVDAYLYGGTAALTESARATAADRVGGVGC